MGSDIAYAMHQCAKFCSDPKESHVEVIIYLGRYLKGTRNKGLILDLSAKDFFLVWEDADFLLNWVQQTTEVDPSTAKLRFGYVIMMIGCPVIWVSKLQT